jgi:hypothetical protein
MTRYVLSCLLVPCLAVAAGQGKGKKEELAPNGLVYSSTELTRTNFMCYFIENEDTERISPGPTNLVKCEFTQLSIWGPDDADAEAEKAGKKFDENWGKMSDAERSKAFSDLKTGCTPAKKAEMAKFRDDETASEKKHPQFAALQPALAASSAPFEAMCGCSTPVCFRAAEVKQAREKAARCTLWAGRYDIVFKRDFHAGGWVNIQTDAPCYASITTTLVHPPDSKDSMFWNMRTVRVPRANPHGPICKDLKVEESEDTWNSWGGGDWVEPQCRQFTFF